jgi:hypothetical protein
MINNKNIVIESIESKQASTGNWKYILIDNQKNKYYFYRTIQGQDGDVYLSFIGMNPQKGSVVAIGYIEEDKSFVNTEGKTINFKDRSIVSLREASGVPVQTSVQTPVKTEPIYHPVKERDFEAENIGKCQSLFLQAYIQSGHSIEEAILKIDYARDLATRVVRAESEQIAPDIQQTAEQMVADIPF